MARLPEGSQFSKKLQQFVIDIREHIMPTPYIRNVFCGVLPSYHNTDIISS